MLGPWSLVLGSGQRDDGWKAAGMPNQVLQVAEDFTIVLLSGATCMILAPASEGLYHLSTELGGPHSRAKPRALGTEPFSS